MIPVVGQWYEDLSTKFKVTFVDHDDGRVEVEYQDGSSGEMDIDEWDEEDIAQIEAPLDDEDEDAEDEDDVEDEDEEYDDV